MVSKRIDSLLAYSPSIWGSFGWSLKVQIKLTESLTRYTSV